ncbi:MAG: molybdopterin biosynthesis protein, partial [Firmicutes bacterium HGW-Firmicutes-13]
MLVKRKIYLDNVPLNDAFNIFFQKIEESHINLEADTVPVGKSLGRITAEPVFALISSPHYHASAMDGVAVRAADTFGAMETSPKTLKLKAQYVPVDTGHPLPQGFDAVIMIEDIHQIDDQTIEITSAAAPWQHVRVMGEDIVATELILPVNHRIRPEDIAAVLAGGIWEVKVRKKPVVAIIPTGSELVQPGEAPRPGKIIEFNSRFFSSLISEWGGDPRPYGIVKDEYDKIKSNLLSAADKSDVVLINAGSSAGSRDYTAAVVEEAGELLVHGVAIKPGKPTVIGMVKNTPVIGVPGYPVSAFFALDLLVRPLIYKLQSLPVPERDLVEAVMSRRVVSSFKSEEFLRVKLGQVGQNLTATPLPRGAGVVTSLVRADGFVRIPQLKEGLETGEKVQVELIKDLEEIKNTVVAIGSHDLTLDIISNLLRLNFPEISLSSAHVGSMGGIMAIRRGEAHLAGSHLLDEKTGEYNVPYIKRLLPNKEVFLVNLVYRQQGLIVMPGNPKGIKSLEDLTKDDAAFINRQKGAGTRLLLDYHLNKLGIKPEYIKGYEREEYSHLSVAAAVASGAADVGLGVLAAAKALGLDFISLA